MYNDHKYTVKIRLTGTFLQIWAHVYLQVWKRIPFNSWNYYEDAKLTKLTSHIQYYIDVKENLNLTHNNIDSNID